MELLVGLLGALVGTAAGGLSAFFTSRAQMRRELEYAYDREVRAWRVQGYISLYKRTANFPRYWPTNPARTDLRSWVDGLDDWYFAEAGGLFLSNNTRQAYLSLLDVMAAIANDNSSGGQLSDEEVDRMWRAGQALCRQLAADIGAAENPRMIAVGTVLADGPPHRSQRALLTHWAPASGTSVKTHAGKGMLYAGWW